MIYGGVCLAWLILGGVTKVRSTDLSGARSEVEGLWGGPHEQRAPELVPAGKPMAQQVAARSSGPQPATQQPAVVSVSPASTNIDVALSLDQRMKGLRWFSLYDVAFDGAWRFEVPEGEHEVVVELPNAHAIYDDFLLTIDGEDQATTPQHGTLRIPVPEGAREIAVGLRYKSRGLDTWRYVPSSTSGSLRDFTLLMRTNFGEIEFPDGAMSPSKRAKDGAGAELVWTFSNILTTRGVGMVMPQRIQPGELASQLSFTAPISLFFFFLIVGILTKLEKLDVHPINYMFLAAAFFSFHLLLSYTVDTLPLGAAFGLASFVSVAMVTSYLRLVVNARFGVLKAGAAQLVYLVGFSAAHFLEGLTGLTVTILSIATLFVLMLLTGRIRWTEVLARRAAVHPEAGPYRTIQHEAAAGAP